MSPSRRIIITGGDENYFPLIRESIASIKEAYLSSSVSPPDIGVLCPSMSSQSRKVLEQEGCILVEPNWAYAPASYKHRNRDWLKINLNKSRLDLLFPGYDAYLWIDGDTWVQTADGPEMFFNETLRRRCLSVVPVLSVRRSLDYRLRWIPVLEVPIYRPFLFRHGKRSGMPRHLVRHLTGKHELNCGAWCLPGNSSHWETWRKWHEKSVKWVNRSLRGRLFTTDTMSLALAVYEDSLSYSLLPDTCNYIYPPWRYDRSQNQLIDYNPPHKPVGIVHMAHHDECTMNPEATVAGFDENDAPMEIPLRYMALRKLRKPDR